MSMSTSTKSLEEALKTMAVDPEEVSMLDEFKSEVRHNMLLKNSTA
jgi:hypothetical protein